MQNLTKKQPFYNGLQRFTHSKVLNSRVIDEFIDNIYIKEDNTIIIDFKFKEPYKDTIEYLKSKNI